MYLEQDSHGNIQVYQNSMKRSHWGFIDKDRNYNTSRSAKKGQIFHLYRHAIAVQLELLEYLEKTKCNLIKIYIQDYEKEGFFAIAKVDAFREMAFQEFGYNSVFNYDKQDYSRYGKQIRLPLNRFSR
ncbi:MAG: hypothetical protein AABY22_34490, partial [Nanoarchaeota archaeon]